MSGWYNTGAGYQVSAWVAVGLAMLFTVVVVRLVVWPVLRRRLGCDPARSGEATTVVLGLCLLLIAPWWAAVLWFWNGVVWIQVQPDGSWCLRNAYGWANVCIASQTERRLLLNDFIRSYTTYSVEEIPQHAEGIGVVAHLDMRSGERISLEVEDYLDPRLATGSIFFSRLGYTPERASLSSGALVFDWHSYAASGPVFP